MHYDIIININDPIWTSPKSKTHIWQISSANEYQTIILFFYLYSRCHKFILHDIYISNGLSAIAA